jgi:O-acetyl-ADP-ribose deacetylase (regulator of RNase III)
VDVIVGSSSSGILRRTIINAAGNEIQIAYNNEYKNNPNSLLIVTPPGALLCKRIFFIKWEPAADEEILRQSLVDVMWNVVQHVITYKFTSIAFPAIGCGKHGCSIDVVVKTMVKEMKEQLMKRNLPWTVKFLLQPDQQNIYDEFCNQLLTTQDGKVQYSKTYHILAEQSKSHPCG